MQLISPVFGHNQSIPPLFTQDGDNISPPLHWGEAPEGTVSYALIVDDPDAPHGVFTHWVLYNLPAVMHGLDREVGVGGHYGTQSLQGLNAKGQIGYTGPKPPSGEHRYIFTLYALDSLMPLQEGASKQDLLQAMQGHILDHAELIGLYAKHDPVEISKELKEEREEEDAYDRAAHSDRMDAEDGEETKTYKAG